MKHTYDGYNYTLRLTRGEKLVESLTSFVKETGLQGGWLVGLGGLAWAELGFYDLKSKEYRWRKLNLDLELISLTGNIAWQENEPVLHLHASTSDTGLQMYGGHLKEAEVAGTVEIFVHNWQDDSGLRRSYDEETGLNLLGL